MAFQIGDSVKYKSGVHPELSSNIYVVIKKVFVNPARQDTIEVRNEETNQELFKDPEDLELLPKV